MATRRELLTAVNLVVNTHRNNDAMYWTENALQNINVSTGEAFVLSGEPDSPVETVEQQVKKSLKFTKKEIKRKAKAIKKVLQKAPSGHVSRGLEYKEIMESDVEADAIDSGDICEAVYKAFEGVETFSEMKALSLPFIAYQPKLIKAFTSDNLPDAVNHANIINSVIDAMAWELKGLNENTGEPHGRTPEQFDKLIKNRLFVAKVHLLKSSDLFEDVADLRAAVAYVRKFYKGKNNIELAEYLDKNIPKNISIRKAWSL